MEDNYLDPSTLYTGNTTYTGGAQMSVDPYDTNTYDSGTVNPISPIKSYGSDERSMPFASAGLALIVIVLVGIGIAVSSRKK